MFFYRFLIVTIALLFCYQKTTLLYGNTKVAASEEEHFPYFEIYAKVLRYIELLYVDKNKVDKKILIRNSIRGMLSGLDPHSIYLPKESFKAIKIDTSGKFGGIGVRVGKRGKYIVIINVIPDTPASKAGILAGDKIIAVDGIKTKKFSIDEIVQKIQGPKGSKVIVSIKRKNQKKTLNFDLKREIIKLKSVRHFEIVHGYVYIGIQTFQEKTDIQVKNALTQYLKKYRRIKGIILDLRNNPGGLLDQAIKICDMFLDSGVIVSTIGRDPKNKEVAFAHNKDTLDYFPMITLVNEASASASEIVAGALQDHKRSLILGAQTFGKGSVQTLLELPDGSGLKLTIARYYTPSNRSIQAKGITPDIIVSQRPEVAKVSLPALREKDLKGHFSASPTTNKDSPGSIKNFFSNLDPIYQKDHQLITAINYLFSYNFFDSYQKQTENIYRSRLKKETP